MKKLTSVFICASILMFLSGTVLSGQSDNWRKEANDKLRSLFEKHHASPAQPSVQAPSAGNISAIQAPAPAGLGSLSRDLAPAERMLKQEVLINELEAAGKSPAEIRAMLSSPALLTGTGSISGFVYESNGSTTVVSTLVRLYDEYGYYYDYVYTDETGAYQFTGLAAGGYYVQSRNYSFVRVYYNGAPDPADATLVPVVDGQDTPDINFVLKPLVVITGRVFEADSETPIANQGAAFQLYVDGYFYGYAASTLRQTHSLTLDDSGKYTIGVDPRDIKLSIGVEGYVGEFYQDATDVESATVITVAATADTIKDIDFVLALLVSADDGYEQNNTTADASAISYGDVIDARIDPAGDVDYFTFSGTANDTVTIDIDAQIDYGIGASDIDSYLELIDSSGTNTIQSNDDYNPPGYEYYSLDSRIEYYVLPYTGNYFVKVRDLFNMGGPDYIYSLSLVKGGAPPPPPEPDDPYEPNDTWEESASIACGDTVRAFINPESDVDWFTFTGEMGDTISVDVRAVQDGAAIGSSNLSLLDSETVLIAGGDYYYYDDPRIDGFILPYTGDYLILYDASWQYGTTDANEAFYTLYLIKGRLRGAIAGSIKDAAGEALPIRNIVYLYDAVTGEYIEGYITLADSTTYVVPDVSPGDYHVRLHPLNPSPDTTYCFGEWYNNAADRGDATTVTVVAGDTTTGVDFVLETGGYIFGLMDFPAEYQTDVFDMTQILLYNVDDGGVRVLADGWLSFAKGFKMGLLTAGTYKLAATHLFTNLPATYYGGGAFYDDASSTPIVLEAKSTADIQMTTLAPGDGSISGTIYHTVDSVYATSVASAADMDDIYPFVLAYDSTGHIVQAAFVGMDSETGTGLAAGTFKLPGLAEGTYYLNFLAYLMEPGVDSLINIWYPYVPLPMSIIDEGVSMYSAMIPESAAKVEVTADILNVTGIEFYLDGYVEPPAGVDVADNGLPTEFALRQNYPNPFNPSTTIRFELPKSTDISITVYDILGREVIRLMEGHREAGYYQVVWNGRTGKGQEVTTGIYIVRMVTATGYTRSIKMVMLK